MEKRTADVFVVLINELLNQGKGWSGQRGRSLWLFPPVVPKAVKVHGTLPQTMTHHPEPENIDRYEIGMIV